MRRGLRLRRSGVGMRDGAAARRGLAALAVAAVALVTATGGMQAAARTAPRVCGTRAERPRPLRYRHVVVIMDENLSLGRLIGPAGSRRFRRARFLNLLARRCALATSYHGATHWSHRNYMAATGGYPLALRQVSRGQSIFSRAAAHGLRWRAYEGGMLHRCQLAEGGHYDREHNAPTYYANLREQCPSSDLPLGTLHHGALARAVARGALPALSWITPDDCHNMHWASWCGYPRSGRIAAGNAWLRRWIGRLTATRAYRRGRMLILVTWDEGSTTRAAHAGEDCLTHLRDPSCHEAAIAVSPYVRPHTRDHTLYSHYSLLRTLASVLGLPAPGHARDASVRSMRRGMGI